MQRRVMGKQGPCYHCGITTTPLWRNGPAEKPVLCNACGSRWRTKGTLANYMPMHSGGLGLKNVSIKKLMPMSNEHRSLKRKEPSCGYSDYSFYPVSEYHVNGMPDDDASTRSSTGSDISFSDSCMQHLPTSGRASGAILLKFLQKCMVNSYSFIIFEFLTGTECWPPWGFHVPSKRRSVMHRCQPSIKRFSSLPSSKSFFCRYSSEEDLLVECKALTTEIGLGGVFIRPSMAQDSQSSSVVCDNKEMDESVILSENVIRETDVGIEFSHQSVKHKGKEKTYQLSRNYTGTTRNHVSKGWMANKTLLDNFPYNRHAVLQSCHSPLVFVELKDIINFDTFMGLLTDQERERLVQYVSSSDAHVDSLSCMFSSAQFESSLRLFQDLLNEGMFDSESGLSPRVLQHYQHLLTLPDLLASNWMEKCSQFLNQTKRKSVMDNAKIIHANGYMKEKMTNLAIMGLNQLSGNALEMKNQLAENQVLLSIVDCKAEASPDSVSVHSDVTIHTHSHQAKHISRQKRNSLKKDNLLNGAERSNSKTKKSKEREEKFSTKNYRLIEAPSYGILDHEILLDLPSNVSFQQAELLQQPVWSRSLASDVEEALERKTDDLVVENAWHNEPESDLAGLLQNSPSSGSVSHTLQ